MIDEKRLAKLSNNPEWGRYDRDELLTTLALALKVVAIAKNCHGCCECVNDAWTWEGMKEALAPFSEPEEKR